MHPGFDLAARLSEGWPVPLRGCLPLVLQALAQRTPAPEVSPGGRTAPSLSHPSSEHLVQSSPGAFRFWDSPTHCVCLLFIFYHPI